MHLGGPVVPELNITNSGWLKSNRGQRTLVSPAGASLARYSGTDSGGAGASSRAITNRSDRKDAASSPIRSRTCASPGIARASKLAIRMSGSSCSRRLSSACGAKSGGALENVAPTAAHASPATIASGLFATTAATRSPGETPSSRSS